MVKIIEFKPEFEDEYLHVHNRAFAGEESAYDNKLYKISTPSVSSCHSPSSATR